MITAGQYQLAVLNSNGTVVSVAAQPASPAIRPMPVPAPSNTKPQTGSLLAETLAAAARPTACGALGGGGGGRGGREEGGGGEILLAPAPAAILVAGPNADVGAMLKHTVIANAYLLLVLKTRTRQFKARAADPRQNPTRSACAPSRSRASSKMQPGPSHARIHKFARAVTLLQQCGRIDAEQPGSFGARSVEILAAKAAAAAACAALLQAHTSARELLQVAQIELRNPSIVVIFMLRVWSRTSTSCKFYRASIRCLTTPAATWSMPATLFEIFCLLALQAGAAIASWRRRGSRSTNPQRSSK